MALTNLSSSSDKLFSFASHDDLSRFLKDYYLEKLNTKEKKDPVIIINGQAGKANFVTLRGK